MATCKLSAEEYIQNSFAPQVAILCSEDADYLALKNNLRFVELLQPFSKINGEAKIVDPSGNAIQIKNLKVSYEDMNHKPPQATIGKKILSEAVSNTGVEDFTPLRIESENVNANIDLNLQTATTPWYEVWRELFLQVQYPSDHEFTKHFIACIIVVSSASENAMEQLNKLSQYQHQQQHQNPTRFPKWFSPNILKYYLILHDTNQTELSRAEELLDQMQSAYGTSNCSLLKINSLPLEKYDINTTDIWNPYFQRKCVIDSATTANINSEGSSGTGTPRDDLLGLPSRVTEGDSPDSSESSQLHPLSPVVSPPDEKNGVVDGLTLDVPLLLNRESLPSGNANHHGGCLLKTDIEEIRQFTENFCLKSLIPHAERQIKYLNEVVTNRSKSKSLFSATRRWLGASKVPSTTTNSVIYSSEATELQTRRLGDLCFMFGLFEMAYNAYHTAKNDFKSDQAWLYFAGAQEMAALAAFLNNNADFPKRYLEGSLHTYLNVCKVYNFAIRLTLFTSEILKNSGDYSEAAMVFIKMTSEESDLLSALMLEQAAYCFIKAKHPFVRKYAFHMTLAGHRFSKAGQKSHSLRTYQHALQVYYNRHWILAEDHIHYSIGKQAFLLKRKKESLEATTHLIDPDRQKKGFSQQSNTQQMVYVREFLNTLHQYLTLEENAGRLSLLPIPVISAASIKVFLGTPQPKSADKKWVGVSHVSFSDEDFREQRWFALENDLVSAVQGPPMKFRPNLQRMSNLTPNTFISHVPVKELVSVQFLFHNPLLVSLTISDIHPIYEMFDDSDNLISEIDGSVVNDVVAGFNLPGDSSDSVILNLFPQVTGRLSIKGIAYSICLTADMTSHREVGTKPLTVTGKQLFNLKGPRLNSNANERSSRVYAKDERLNIKIIPEMPKLSIRLRDLPAILSCGELLSSNIVIENISSLPLQNLYYAVTDPKSVFISFNSKEKINKNITVISKKEETSNLKGLTSKIDLPDGILNPGQKLNGDLWVHSPVTPGGFDIEILFYYEPINYPLKNRYRLLRHLSSIYLEPCIALKVFSLPSLCVHHFEKSESSSHTHSSNLNFVIKNKSEVEGSPTHLQITGVSYNSVHWASKTQQLPMLPYLALGETIQFCSKILYLRDGSEDNLFYSYIPLSSEENLLPRCWWRFCLRERLHFLDVSADPLPPNKAADYIPPPPTPDEIDLAIIDKAKRLDMIVTVTWQGKRGEDTVYGQQSVLLNYIGDHASSPFIKDFDKQVFLGLEDERLPIKLIKDEKQSEESKTSLSSASLQQSNLIKITLSFPKTVLHNFSLQPLCEIEYKLSLYNCCGCSLLVTIEFSSKISSTNDGSQMQLFSPRANANILTIGVSKRKCLLGPWTSNDLALKSLVTSPGTYCLGLLTLRVRRERGGEEWLQQLNDFHSAVVVSTDNDSLIDRCLSSELCSMQLTCAALPNKTS